MNAKHTPGPWIADGYNVRVRNGRYVAYTGPSHTPDSEYPKQCSEEDKANARLIAASPELLEALEKAVSRQGFSNDDLISARAIIAKAKGEL